MKKVVYTILIISVVFLCNIGLYFYSDTYSFFLKQMKYWDDIPTDYESLITDDYLLKNFTGAENPSCNCEVPPQPECPSPIALIEPSTDSLSWQNNLSSLDTQKIEQEKKQQQEKRQQHLVRITPVLAKFSSYKLIEKPYDEYYNMFDVSDEYPNPYYTYTWENLEMYFFPESSFENFYNIFTLLSKDAMVRKFELNTVQNFWKKTFFINLEPKDDAVRIVVQGENILVWLKFKKSYYNDIKNILLQKF